MTSQSPRQVRVGVGAFVLESPQESYSNNPRLLIGKRIGSHGAGTYALPGGHLEFGETPEMCAVREVLEETGLKVSNPRFLTATNDYMPMEDKHYVTLFMVCERENNGDKPEVLEPEKCEGWDWVTWEDIVMWATREIENGDGGERKLFLPLLNLVRQRPGVTPTFML